MRMREKEIREILIEWGGGYSVGVEVPLPRSTGEEDETKARRALGLRTQLSFAAEMKARWEISRSSTHPKDASQGAKKPRALRKAACQDGDDVPVLLCRAAHWLCLFSSVFVFPLWATDQQGMGMGWDEDSKRDAMQLLLGPQNARTDEETGEKGASSQPSSIGAVSLQVRHSAPGTISGFLLPLENSATVTSLVEDVATLGQIIHLGDQHRERVEIADEAGRIRTQGVSQSQPLHLSSCSLDASLSPGVEPNLPSTLIVLVRPRPKPAALCLSSGLLTIRALPRSRPRRTAPPCSQQDDVVLNHPKPQPGQHAEEYHLGVGRGVTERRVQRNQSLASADAEAEGSLAPMTFNIDTKRLPMLLVLVRFWRICVFQGSRRHMCHSVVVLDVPASWGFEDPFWSNIALFRRS
ncbi:hypothetical protein CMUS01_01301 [Colletotrichum musicola]|uniref:Uncharacterized protein n=1 Tax=Colletotrichum musicola TaxID=2175873 RepID=A0A8H6NX97_9PEZI|nr:hypothetical protein CMUS01_01301 [Colletotrichum musicola]